LASKLERNLVTIIETKVAKKSEASVTKVFWRPLFIALTISITITSAATDKIASEIKLKVIFYLLIKF
jgi:hypothetical protein